MGEPPAASGGVPGAPNCARRRQLASIRSASPLYRPCPRLSRKTTNSLFSPSSLPFVPLPSRHHPSAQGQATAVPRRLPTATRPTTRPLTPLRPQLPLPRLPLRATPQPLLQMGLQHREGAAEPGAMPGVRPLLGRGTLTGKKKKKTGAAPCARASALPRWEDALFRWPIDATPSSPRNTKIEKRLVS